MTALRDDTGWQWYRLQIGDIDRMLAIEEQVYTHPWTRGNFEDSFHGDHEIWGLLTEDGRLAAYFLTMPVLEELHLLNFAVALPFQGMGLAKKMSDFLLERANEQAYQSVLLEVRAGNGRAIHIYERSGFESIGRRKGYYPVSSSEREDAIVMRRMCP